MGLELDYEDIPEQKTQIAKIRDPKNPLKSASVPFGIDNDLYKDLKTISPMGTFFPEEWKGKNLATELYKEMENRTNGKIVPGDDQTDASFGLHDKRGFGKDFGIKDETLDKLLTPAERAERNTRKESLKRGLTSLADEFSRAGSEKYKPKWEDVESDYDKKILKASGSLPEIDPRNIGTLFDRVLHDAKKIPTGKEAGEFIRNNIPRVLSKVKSFAPHILTGGAGLAYSAVSEAADAESSGAPPDTKDYWMEKGYNTEESKLKAFKSGLTTGKGYSKIPGAYEKPELKQYKEDVLNAEREGSLLDNYVDTDLDKRAKIKALELYRKNGLYDYGKE
jgi:hypothetical protein